MLLALVLATPSPDANITVTPIFEKCSSPGESCAKTDCCTRPGYACFSSVQHPHHKECRRRVDAHSCNDTAEWRCPTSDMCSKAFGDCRTSLCCQNLAFFRGARNVQFQCKRRPHLYYAQCQPPSHTGHACVDTPDWLCEGWERCATAHQECSISRCCADEGFACFLNASALAAGSGWHAYCLPQESATDAEDWLHPAEWMAHVHEAVELAEWYAIEEPAEVAAGFLLIMLLVAGVALACCLVHRRKMRAQLDRIERELDAARAQRQEAKTKASGEGEGMALRETVAREISEEGPPTPGVPTGALDEARATAALAPACDASEELATEVVVQATWGTCGAEGGDETVLPTPPAIPRPTMPPSHSRDAAVAQASASKAATADAAAGEAAHSVATVAPAAEAVGEGRNAARAMAALQNKRSPRGSGPTPEPDPDL